MSLYNIGPMVEKNFGREQFMLVYLGSGVAGNLLSYMMSPNNGVGASGAIFGLVGAMGVYLMRHQDLFGEQGERQGLTLVHVSAQLELFCPPYNPK
jgi:rhomboid protease GluP